MGDDRAAEHVLRYPLLDALRQRRSRRFGLGMCMDGGPLSYRSRRAPVRLDEAEEALLAFAGCGITGRALADLGYAAGQGGTILAGLTGRTVASGDAIHTVSVFVINQDATYFLRRPQDHTPEALGELLSAAAAGRFTELYRRSRVEVHSGRVSPPLRPLYNLDVNRWSLYDPAATYFLPVAELTLLYINGLLEVLGESTGAFILDERNGFRPAGLGRFAASRGGHLADDPRRGRLMTISQVESLVTEFVTIELGMVLQNLALMTQALGLGGFPHWAAHAWGWLEALGFRIEHMPASRYLGMGRLRGLAARWLGRDAPVGLATGLEREGRPLLVPHCPPHFPSMEAAVRAVVDAKFGPRGIFRARASEGAWLDATPVAEAAAAPTDATVAATIAFCEYVWRRYGRFPAYAPPFRTVLGYQVNHVDPDFYDRFYGPNGLSDTQREHFPRWHGRDEP